MRTNIDIDDIQAHCNGMDGVGGGLNCVVLLEIALATEQSAFGGGRFKIVPLTGVCERMREDLGRIPSFQDWATNIRLEPWMCGQRLTKTTEV